jgi:hypothetical protein
LIRIQVKYIGIKNHTLGNNNGLLKLKEYVSAQNDASQTAESPDRTGQGQTRLSEIEDRTEDRTDAKKPGQENTGSAAELRTP